MSNRKKGLATVQELGTSSTADLNLDQCAQEPIRIPGAIQPFGALLLLAAHDQCVISASVNCAEVTGLSITQGEPLSHNGDEGWNSALDAIREWSEGESQTLSANIRVQDRHLYMSGSRSPQGLLVEFEAVDAHRHTTLDALYPQLRSFLDDLDPSGDPEVILQRASAELRRLTGFDRVLVYRFDADGHGTVVAEDNNGVLPVYMNHRFPASDIPTQARQLYCLNRVRLIPDSSYVPVPLEPAFIGPQRQPVDLTYATWRSVSPIHVEYMRNMGTHSSMSVSLVIDGELWGLLSCHSAAPHHVQPQVRAASELLGRILAQQLGANERISEHTHRIELKKVEVELVDLLARSQSLQEGFKERSPAWMSLLQAQGAALVWQDQIYTVGNTPSESQISQIVDWLADQGVDQTYSTEHLAQHCPGAEAFADVASGLAAASISQVHQSFLLWFRPQKIRTVSWRGNPHKSLDPVSGRLHPRKSFDIWQEQVSNRALPWRRSECDALTDFRNVVVNLILKRAEERAELTEQLQRSNVELESFSYSVSHDLRAPFRHIAGFAELLKRREGDLDDTSTHYIDNIVRAAVTAGRLVDDLLRFSHLGRAALAPQTLDMNKMVAEVRQAVELSLPDARPRWNISPLPPGYGDPKYIRQVWYNLMENAVKYSSTTESPVIRITGSDSGSSTIFCIEDNGVGFDMAYVGKLFGVFQRLHHHDDFEGTGIGLALSKRIVEKHGGWIKGEGAVNQGARFSFALPAQ
ncbi:two component sensor kinase for capsular biosynthesis [Bordetella ansorpii]|uniref:histidine kinase n=1 Tax=Bordetella ansorpii TaxID=288768 RepID=A0A157SV38_9BORD|nr:two component sensor kinase for capsular biosynthesis [Bordetella ansorpii]